MKFIFTIVLFISSFYYVNAQFNFYEDQFHGGVTGNGYSIAYNDSVGSSDVYLHIPQSSSIRKAFLLVQGHGSPDPISIDLNGVSYDIDSSTVASPVYNDPFYGGPSAIHAIEITNDISVADTVINISFSTQPLPNTPNYDGYNRFRSAYIYVAYDDTSFSIVNSVIFLNDQDIQPVNIYEYTVATPFPNVSNIGVSNLYSNVCVQSDGYYVSINGSSVGVVYGPEPGSGFCGGPLGSFYYENDVFYGIGSDQANNSVDEGDAIFDATDLIGGSPGPIEMAFSTVSGIGDNTMWATFFTYGQQSYTGINEVINKSVSIFPNPAKQVLFVDFDDPEEYTNLYLKNALGQHLKVIKCENNLIDEWKINISDFPNGVYFLEAITKTNEVEVIKFLKQ